MAYDPDLQPIIDDLTARIAALEANPGSTNSAVTDANLRFYARLSNALLPLDDAGRVALFDSLIP